MWRWPRPHLIFLLLLTGSPHVSSVSKDKYLSCTGWHLYFGTGHCYKIFCDKTKWGDAQKFCHESGGNLATISNADEHEFINGLLHGSLEVQDAWIGYRRAIYRGPFTWVDGTPSGFELWARFEPNNRDLREACTFLRQDGRFYDLNCYNELNFICERDSCQNLPN